jgi:CelD/BcsL family acetyltransferase involved in cellulose biosynthesis
MILETIEDSAGFRRLRDEWNELLEASNSNCLFLTWEWLHTWWRHLSDGRRLSILTARREGRLVAIVPLALRPQQLRLLMPFHTLEFLGTGSVGSDYLDVIIRRGMEEETVRVLADYLGHGKQVLEFAQFKRGDSCAAPALAGQLRDRNWSSTEVTIGVCPFIDLSGRSWESYLATLGHEYRRNFKRRLRQLTAQFAFSFELAVSEDQRREALQALLDLHERRWQERGGSDAFHTPDLRAFHDELTQLALQRGWLRLFLMRLDGRPAAALYGFMYDRRFYFYQQGFDPRFARYSLGLVMTGLTIQEAIKEGAGEYDFLSGDEEFKFHWAADARELGRLGLTPPGLRGLLCKEILRVSRATRRMARQVLPKPLVRRIATGRAIPSTDGGTARDSLKPLPSPGNSPP